ncbi:MAG: hypothetical protein H6741_32355 [Alphaproteobacteria bacterium]|nr:hypothetical protein [Alphaproteobacteria bacterium]
MATPSHVLPGYARAIAAEQAPAGCYWPAVIDDFARFGWVHLGCNAHDGGIDWYWRHGEGGVLVVRCSPDWRVQGMAVIEGEDARRIAAQSPAWPALSEVQGG